MSLPVWICNCPGLVLSRFPWVSTSTSVSTAGVAAAADEDSPDTETSTSSEALAEDMRSMDDDVFSEGSAGSRPGGAEAGFPLSFVSAGTSAGVSLSTICTGLAFALLTLSLLFLGLRLLAWLRLGVGILPATDAESKDPCDISWRQDMMRSSAGWVEVLSLLGREEGALEKRLEGRPILLPVRLLKTEDASQLSATRSRFVYAQSWRKTLMAPV
jgi:hypothetical protein